MQIPLEITFRGMEPSAAVEAKIRTKAEKLERFFEHIMACRVAVEVPHSHHHKGKLYRVRVDVTVPDGELLASRGNDEDRAHEDIYVVIRDAFNAVQRQLEDYARRRRGDIKSHPVPGQLPGERLLPE